ncbi:hypothetical protein TNCV_1987641 [Trichonephila clavipes]|nr:hypothetical protein TNCV_1987641 [Trichonephila clavipes]
MHFYELIYCELLIVGIQQFLNVITIHTSKSICLPTRGEGITTECPHLSVNGKESLVSVSFSCSEVRGCGPIKSETASRNGGITDGIVGIDVFELALPGHKAF